MYKPIRSYFLIRCFRCKILTACQIRRMEQIAYYQNPDAKHFCRIVEKNDTRLLTANTKAIKI